MITADFTYETKIGTTMNAHLQCIDFDDVGSSITFMLEWMEDNGYRMKSISIVDKVVMK